MSGSSRSRTAADSTKSTARSFSACALYHLSALLRRQHRYRVEGLASAAADLEMQPGARRAARTAGAGDGLAFLHLVPLLGQQRLVVAVGGDVARAVLDQQQVAEMGHTVAGIDDLAAIGCLHRRAVAG